MNDEFRDTEIGRIPREWEIKKIKDIATYITDGTHKTPHYVKYNQSSIPFISTENIQPYSSEFDFSRYKRYIDEISYTELSKRTNAEKGDLLISKCGTIGRTQLIRKHVKIGIFVGLLLLKINDNIINGQYLEYLLNSDKFRKIMESSSSGSTRKTLAISIFKDISIPSPPLEEQKRIAYVLSKIQNAIEIQNKLLKLLQELKKTMMHKLFTEGIGHTEFKDTEIGRIPREWEIRKISELFSIQHGISITPTRKKLKPNYPMLRTINVEWGKISLEKLDYSWFSEKEIENLNLKYGDLLLCEGGDIGRTAMWREELKKVGYQNHLHRLRKINKYIQPLFYMYWLQYAILHLDLYINEGNITTIPNLSKSKIMNFKVVYANSEEQNRISYILSTIDNKISIETKRKESFEKLFKTMLNKLMTGQIRTKNMEMVQ
ncbi:restriction endonuclease subunit S [Ferroplasma sp.]|uniref:restriction endonuclease subunit S n=1 Tax=Ferroplasma sp. TaxID=2591003 RepID=UPI00260612A3|nr:restriction endonuclease subunit S [Ferroplasma sp.]